MIAPSRAWVFGDNIDTDVLAPGLYMKGPITELARHCLEAVEPRFAHDVKPGDFVIGGRNFGMGSSREQAVMALRTLGVAAVVAPSFAGIFYRNALNLGLLALVCPNARAIADGALLRLDAERAQLCDSQTGQIHVCEKMPDHLLAMVTAGGLLPHLKNKLNPHTTGEPSA